MSVCAIFGTRPEAIKLAPVVAALRQRGVVVPALCTGQHTDLLAGTPAETVFADAVNLHLPAAGNVLRWETTATAKLVPALRACAPTCVRAVGDTMTVAAAAEAAVVADLPFVHVEAGVRSGDLHDPWPEEGLRRHISHLAEVHYCATHTALHHLEREQIRGVKVMTGNAVVTPLADVVAAATPQPTVLITLHRRELRLHADAFDILRRLLQGCNERRDTRFIIPAHPAMRFLWGMHSLPPNTLLVNPLAHTSFLKLLVHARGVITDSGGVVEEAATLGIPTVILRDANDRPEAVTAGIARLVPRRNAQLAVAALDGLPRTPCPVFGTSQS